MAQTSSLTEKSQGELLALLDKERNELRTLRFFVASSRPKDSAGPQKARRTIARILTELRFRARSSVRSASETP